MCYEMNWKQMIFTVFMLTIGFLLFVLMEAEMYKIDFLTALIASLIAFGFVGLLGLVLIGCFTILAWLGD